MPSSLNNILKLFHHPYWMRVWIIQEITVASNVHVLYGDHVLPWEKLLRILSKLEQMGSRHSFPISYSTLSLSLVLKTDLSNELKP